VLEDKGVIAVHSRDGRVVRIRTGMSRIFIQNPDQWNYVPAQLKAAGRLQAALDALPPEKFLGTLRVGQVRIVTTVAVALVIAFAVTMLLFYAGGVFD
jgi:hypothetical protein